MSTVKPLATMDRQLDERNKYHNICCWHCYNKNLPLTSASSSELVCSQQNHQQNNSDINSFDDSTYHSAAVPQKAYAAYVLAWEMEVHTQCPGQVAPPCFLPTSPPIVNGSHIADILIQSHCKYKWQELLTPQLMFTKQSPWPSTELNQSFSKWPMALQSHAPVRHAETY